MFNPFRREEIQALIFRCECLRDTPGTNPDWRRIYDDIVHALDHLDAAIARSTVQETQFKKLYGQVKISKDELKMSHQDRGEKLIQTFQERIDSLKDFHKEAARKIRKVMTGKDEE
jgi:hypothetical protein